MHLLCTFHQLPQSKHHSSDLLTGNVPWVDLTTSLVWLENNEQNCTSQLYFIMQTYKYESTKIYLEYLTYLLFLDSSLSGGIGGGSGGKESSYSSEAVDY